MVWLKLKEDIMKTWTNYFMNIIHSVFFFKEKFKMKKCTVFVIFQYIEKKWNIL